MDKSIRPATETVTITEVVSSIQNTLRVLEIDAHRANLGYEFLIKATKRQALVGALVRNKWNQCKAARDLHIHRNTLWRTMVELEIFPPEDKRRRLRARQPASVRKVAFGIQSGKVA